jgi:hypothetical protein
MPFRDRNESTNGKEDHMRIVETAAASVVAIAAQILIVSAVLL